MERRRGRRIRLAPSIGLSIGLGLAVASGPRPSAAAPGDVRVIVPGHEAKIADLVRAAVGHDQAAISIEPDRIRVRGPEPYAPQWVVFAPDDVVRGEPGDALAKGVLVQCGETRPGPCPAAHRDELAAVALRLADARDRVADEIWTGLDSGAAALGPAPADAAPVRGLVAGQPDASSERGIGELIDRVVALLAIGSASILLAAHARRMSGPQRRTVGRWALAVAAVVAVFLALALTVPPMVPMHEHNSFVARSDCAIDPRCTFDPQAAWSMTTFHVYGWLLSALPYRLPWLSIASLAMSTLVVVLAFAVTHALSCRLGEPRLAPWGGLASAIVLAGHPVFWRIAVAATFWPYAIACTLAAALAGLTASQTDPRELRWLGWLCAASWFALACTGNLVLLTLGPLVFAAPLAWRTASGRRTSMQVAIGGLAVWAVWALAALPDYVAGARRAAEAFATEDAHGWTDVVRKFDPLLLDPRVSMIPWMVLPSLAAPWLASARGTRILAPLLYAWLVPGVFLGLAAGDILGSGYPVGLINHLWELCMTAVLAGLGTTWATQWLARRWPAARQASRIPPLVTAAVVLGGVLGWAGMREGWRLATERRAVDRELAFISAALPRLPAHDVLVIGPDTLEPHDGLPREGDPIEVAFPLGEYRHVMRQRGLDAARTVALDHFDERQRADATIVYVGTSLRSFQPHEIRAGAVRPSLERDPLLALRERYDLVPVVVTDLPTAQHEAVTMRLGADRVETIEVGFYWLRDRSLGSSR